MMSRKQRDAARDRARTVDPSMCVRCGSPVAVLPIYAAFELFHGDDFESWVVTQALADLVPRTGCSASVTYCLDCLSFASTALDGRPCQVTVTL